MSPFAPPKVAAAGQAIHCVKPLGVAELNTASATFAGAKGDCDGSPTSIPLLSGAWSKSVGGRSMLVFDALGMETLRTAAAAQ